MRLRQPTDVPDELRDMGVTGVTQSASGLYIPESPAPPAEPVRDPHALFPWLPERVYSSDRVRELQSSIRTFSPACGDLVERLVDLIEYMTDYRPRNTANDLRYTLHENTRAVEDTWRQWCFVVERPCKLTVSITVEVREIPGGWGVHPDWRYHVQNPTNGLQLKEVTHRVEAMRAAQGRHRAHQFEVVDGVLPRVLDL